MAALVIEPRSHRIGSGELMAGKYLGWAAFAISIGGIPSASADPLADAVRADLPSLVALYEDLHLHPELSFQEKRAAARLADDMAKLGFQVTTGVGKTGVVAAIGSESCVERGC